jgi:tRNA-specific 2-thiouridylase
MGKKLIAVALSGGVDSSTAANLLKKDGHEVIALHMKLWHDSNQGGVNQNDQSKSEEIVRKVKQVCDTIGIPLHLVDLKNDFKTKPLHYL